MKLPLPLGMGPTWNTLGMRSVFVAVNVLQQIEKEIHAVYTDSHAGGGLTTHGNQKGCLADNKLQHAFGIGRT